MFTMEFGNKKKVRVNLAWDSELKDHGLNPEAFQKVKLSERFKALRESLRITNYLDTGDLAIISGIEGESFDYAVPQDWYNEMLDKGENPREYIWLYPEGSIFGYPYNLIESYQEVIRNRFHNGEFEEINL